MLLAKRKAKEMLNGDLGDTMAEWDGKAAVHGIVGDLSSSAERTLA
eukprot:COSAG02_NODE_17755_length_983_cov_2.002262_1_plen_45_part_10